MICVRDRECENALCVWKALWMLLSVSVEESCSFPILASHAADYGQISGVDNVSEWALPVGPLMCWSFFLKSFT